MKIQQTRTWADVYEDLKQIVQYRELEYTQDCVANAIQFLSCLKEKNCLPPFLESGYWPTFSVMWREPPNENLEFEIFDDRIEAYRFYLGKTDILSEFYRPGEPYSDALLAELPSKRSPT